MTNNDATEQTQPEATKEELIGVANNMFKAINGLVSISELKYPEMENVTRMLADTLGRMVAHTTNVLPPPYNDLSDQFFIARSLLTELIEINEQRNEIMLSLLQTANRLDAIVSYDQKINAPVELPKSKRLVKE